MQQITKSDYDWVLQHNKCICKSCMCVLQGDCTVILINLSFIYQVYYLIEYLRLSPCL